MTETSGVDHVWKHIEEQRIALLTTLQGDKLVTRPMTPYPDRAGGVIRFITELDRKTDAIDRESAVNIGYADTSKNTYLSVSGTGRISQDRAKLKELWNPFAQAWLQAGPDGADVALITVDLDEATLWDSTSTKVISVFEHLRAAITGGTPHVGTVEKVSL